MTKTRAKVDFTSGKILAKLIIFTLPILISNLLQVFYNAADMMVVSLSGVDDAVGAIGTTGSFITLITNIYIGFSIGSNIVVARCIGAQDREGTSRAVHTSLIVALIFGFGGGALGILISRPILVAMGNQGVLLELAVTYTYIYFSGIPFVALTNFLSSIFRAKGDSKTPLIVVGCTGVLNVVLNLIFVLAFHLSVEGVSLATAISNAVSSAILFYLLARERELFKFNLRDLKISRKAFRDIIYVGLPSAVQGSLFSISNMLIQSSVVTVNNLMCPPSEFKTSPIINGNAAAANLDGFIFTSMNSITHGIITFSSQNVGAKKPNRVKKILFLGCLISGSVGIIVSLIITLLRTPLLSFYGIGVDDTYALYAVNARTIFVSLPYFLCGIMEVGSGVLRGLGKAISSTVISLLGSCLLRVVWMLFIFPLNMCLENIFISYPITWIVTGATLFIVSLREIGRFRNKVEAETDVVAQ